MSQVASRGVESADKFLPNLILINAGTNDATQDGEHESVEGTPGRMKEMVEGLFEKVPNTVVVLSTLLYNAAEPDNVNDINDGYRKVAKELADDGFKVQLAEMADGFITDDYIHDGTHPTIEGFERMAAVWAWAIDQANSKGWLSEPADSGYPDEGDGSHTCRKEYGSGDDDPRGKKEILTAADPVIADDGPYKHSSKSHAGMLSDDKKVSDDTQIYFAQLINQGAHQGDELDEIIAADGDGENIKIRMNKGGGVFGDWTSIDVKDSCITRGKYSMRRNPDHCIQALTACLPLYRHSLG